MISEPFTFCKAPEESGFDDHAKGRAGKRAE
jgi:hypothetical protein